MRWVPPGVGRGRDVTRRVARLPGACVGSVVATRATARGRRMRVYVRWSGVDTTARATVVAGRWMGPAVARNRAKRRLRAALAATAPPRGLDVVAVAAEGAGSADFGDLVDELGLLLRRAAARAGRSA